MNEKYLLTNSYLIYFINFLKKKNLKKINFNIFLLFLKENKNINKDLNFNKKTKNSEENIKKTIINRKELINNEIILDNYSKNKINFISISNLLLELGIYNFNYIKIFFKFKIINFIYNSKNNIEGIIFLNRNKLNFTLTIKIPKTFFNNMKKKSKIIKDISNCSLIYEYKIYKYYLTKYRDLLFSLLINIIENNNSIDLVLFEAKGLGGNIFQLFIFDFFNNYKNININKKKYNNIKINLNQYNTPMLSNYDFYAKLIKIKNFKINNIFSSINNEYNSWDIEIVEKIIL